MSKDGETSILIKHEDWRCLSLFVFYLNLLTFYLFTSLCVFRLLFFVLSFINF